MSPAWIISRLFDPIVLLVFLILLGSIKSGMTGLVLTQFLILFFTVVILPPIAFLFWAVKSKKVSDWDLSRRDERIKAFCVFVLLFVLDSFIFKNFGNQFIFRLYQNLFLWFLGFFSITLFWKISGHMAGITLACLWLISWYGQLSWLTLFFIPLVGWARLNQKRHTMGELIGGTFYSLIFYLITV